MKKVFIQFRQWILKHRKRLIYGALALFIGQICFLNIGGIQNEVFADNQSDRESSTQQSSFQKVVEERVSLYDFFKKAAYTLVYPMMFLAGKLVDNSLIYGEMFKFDIVLWNLWNVIKNFANYGLGFLFIFYLFRYLITEDKNKNPKWLIIRSLIAGVGIQASWFLMSVLIDISTIMIYGIGGLPLSVLGGAEGGSSEDTDSYVMKNIITVNVNDISNTNFYLANISTGNVIYISECETFAIKDSGGNKGSEEYILGPKMHYYQNQKGEIKGTEKNLCDYYGSVYKFENLTEGLLAVREKINVDAQRGECANDIQKCKDIQSAYDANKDTVKGFLMGNKDKIKAGEVLIPGEKLKDKGYGWDEDNKWLGESRVKTQKMSELMKSQDTKTYVGVFTSLYSSLLEAGRGMIPDTNGSPYIKFLSCILTLGHVLAIAIPLAAALLALLMRVAIIWMAIVLSPMIVLLSAFDFLDEKGNKNFISEYFNLKSLIGIIFSPVVICFAISMSTVLVRLIEKMNYEEVKFQNEYEILGIIHMDLGGFSVGLGKLITGVMGVAISWFLVWMAVKSSKLGEKGGLIDSLHNLASSTIGAAPIIPVPGKDGKGMEFVGATSIFGDGNGKANIFDKMRSNIMNKYNSADEETLRQFVDPESAAERAKQNRETIQKEKDNNKFQGYSDKLFSFSSTQIGSNWTSNPIPVGDGSVSFNDLNDTNKEKIIEKINEIPDVKRKDKFGEAENIRVGNKTYTYDTNEHRYK